MARKCVVLAVVIGAFLVSAQPVAAAPPSWYPQLRWSPAAPENYAVGRGGERVSGIVIHGTDGPYASVFSWFHDPVANASAHYVVRAADGEITQFVTEADTAFHARGVNRTTIGIEHEFDPRRGIGYTAAQYRSSAGLVCAIARRYGLPLDRTHILAHSELPGADHADPGPTWDWSYYMSLVRSCAGGGAVIVSSVADPECDDRACRPRAGVSFGDVGPQVALLQWDLAYLGFIPHDIVAAGGGAFGPRTLAAVRAFQSETGVPATGFYGELTAAALARSLSRAGAAVPRGPLAPGERSAGVEALQGSLRRLGYMDLVTGYYGPITRDAVTAFQRDIGIEPTGTYGPVTRMALAAHSR